MLDEIFTRASIWAAVGTFVTLWALVRLGQWLHQELKIRALGGHAPIVWTLPWSVDYVYNAVVAAARCTTMEHWQDVFEQYNCHTLEISPGGQRVVFTDDPENVKAVLATQFHDFGKGEPFRKDWQDFLGDSIFTTDLEQWHDSRQLLRPLFIRNRVSDLQIFEKHFEKLLGKMGRNGEPVDMAALFFRYTLDAATDFLLGKSVDSLDNPQVRIMSCCSDCV